MTNSKAFRYEFTSVDAATFFYKKVKDMPDIQNVQFPQKNTIHDYTIVLVTPHHSCLFSLQQKLKLDKLYDEFSLAEKKRQELVKQAGQFRKQKDFQAAKQCLLESSRVFDEI